MRVTTPLLVAAGALALAACASRAPNSATPAQAQPATAAKTASVQIPTGRLPDTVEPLAYTLDFTMNPEKAAFTGHTSIRIRIKKPLDTIWLNGRNIDVRSAQVTLADGRTLDASYRQVTKAGVVRLSLPQTLEPQTATLEFAFTNPYAQGLMGSYKVSANGKDYIFTQFEAIAARRAFPSFDQPGFKTPFTMNFTVPGGDKVVANTPVTSKTHHANGMVTWHFKTTHPLPTYLVAWAIGPLDTVTGAPIAPDAERDRPVPLYGVTVAGKGGMIRYALQHAGEIIRAEEQYYGIAYPFDKLSLIAVPDFAAGAMENAGAITFRGILLLMNPKTAPSRLKRAFWGVAAHEMGHMWTGDLVTVPWWNDIWLNEAFATWMSSKIVAELHPDWNAKIHAAKSTLGVMHADSLVSARAIRQPIRDTGDIKTAFDGITYQKGAAVIRMFEHYVGPEDFRRGMHDYLEAHAYGSGTLEGFLHAISKASGRHVGPAFKTFLNQPGLPMIHASVAKRDGHFVVHLEQSRYFPIGSRGDRQAQSWMIPVCFRYGAHGSAHQQCTLLDSHSENVKLKTDSMPVWLMPNAKALGYYQWALAPGGYTALFNAFDKLTAAGQLSVAASIGAAFRDGSINTATAMKALAPLAHSRHHAVAKVPMRLLRFAREHLVKETTRGAVEAYARGLYSGYDLIDDFKPGGAPDNANQRQFELSLAGFLMHTGQDKALQKAAAAAGARLLRANMRAAMSRGKAHGFTLAGLAPGFVPLALSAAVRQQGKPVFNALVMALKHAKSPMIRAGTLRALASTTDPGLAGRLRAMTLNPDIIKQNEVATVLFTQLSQPKTREATWKWIKAHYEALVKRVPGSFGGYLPSIAGMFCSNAKAAQVKRFFQGKTEAHPGARRHLVQAMERAHLCAALKKAQTPSAQKFFSSVAPAKA